MKRLFMITVCVLIGFSAGCSKKSMDEHAVISFLVGEVLVNSVQAEIGNIVKQEDSITTSIGAFCDVKIGDSMIRIRENTKVIFSSLFKSSDGENTSIDLGSGRILCKPKKLLRSESFVVKTPTAVAAVRGTQFMVEADSAETTRVRVYDGSVKMAKRVKQFEENYDRVLEHAPDVSENQMAVVTRDEVTRAESIVEKALQKETAAGTEDAMAKVITDTNKSVVVNVDKIQDFNVADFVNESDELIAIEEKPAEVIKKISREVKLDKEAPKPEGRIVITRHEVYFIKDGIISWQGKLASEPVKKDDRLYVASEGYIFCVQVDGPVLWRAEFVNDGRIELTDKKLSIYSKGKETILDPDTGKRI